MSEAKGLQVKLRVIVDGFERDANEVLRHMGPGRCDPMPPWGWRDLIASCCPECASVAIAEVGQRRYYGPLFGEVRD